MPPRYWTPAASSSPCNAIFSSKGEIIPPCGVPSPVGANPFPASKTPAFSHPAIIPLAGNPPIDLRRFLLEKNVPAELYEIAFVTESRSRWRRKDRRYAGRKNLVARLPGSGRGKSLLLNGHMDTVPPGRSQWSASPWAGNLRKGRIYGLGSFDMKGGLVAQAGV